MYSDNPNKIIILNWDDFFQGKIIPKYESDQILVFKSYTPFIIAAVASPQALSTHAIPIATKITPEEAINRASKPIEDMVLAIAKPVTLISSVWGCIECAVGHPSSGIQRVKYAILGFASIRWIRILVEALSLS